RIDMRRIDFKLEQIFVEVKVRLDEHPITKNPDNSDTSNAQREDHIQLMADQRERGRKLSGHRWMEKEFAQYGSIEVIEKPFGHLKEFKDITATRAYRLFDQNSDLSELEKFLEIRIIDYFYK